MSASIVSTATNARIIAVPLTRPRRSIPIPPSAASPRLTYYQFQLTVKAKQPVSTGSEEKAGWFGWPQEGIVKWASRRASVTWAGFGKAPGGWKLRLHQAGERLVDRMDFEELALKSIDPSLGPSFANLSRRRLKNIEKKNEDHEPIKLPLLYPPSILSSSAVLSELLAYTESRIPKHRRGFYLWMTVAPITAPFMLIPVIPNIPFFFCVWRSWSHYRAYRSSQFLQSLLQNDVIVPEPNDTLDSVYKLPSSTAESDLDPSPSTGSNTSKTSSSPEHELLLTRDAVPKVLKAFDIADGSTAAADLYRAMEQARLRVQSGRLGL